MRKILLSATLLAALGLTLGGCMTAKEAAVASAEEKKADEKCTKSHAVATAIGMLGGIGGVVAANVGVHEVDTDCSTSDKAKARATSAPTQSGPAKPWRNPDLASN